MGCIDINGINLTYDISGNEICIRECAGRGSTLYIPDTVVSEGEEYSVTAIGKKAFLGCKSIREITLGGSIARIDDWAFSQCTNLRKITIPALFVRDNSKSFSLGRRVFEGCESLEQICGTEEMDASISYLAAALVSRLPAEYLLWDDDIGSSHWYLKWDLALTSFIVRKDNEGYTDTVLCGEEDISYDGIASVDGEMLGATYEYVKKVCKNKSYLCLMRLVHDENLSEENRRIYSEYVREHKRGHGNEAAWLALNEDVDDDLDYYRVYTSVADVSADELADMIAGMSEDKAQARAYLISIRPQRDAFDMFDI